MTWHVMPTTNHTTLPSLTSNFIAKNSKLNVYITDGVSINVFVGHIYLSYLKSPHTPPLPSNLQILNFYPKCYIGFSHVKYLFIHIIVIHAKKFQSFFQESLLPEKLKNLPLETEYKYLFSLFACCVLQWTWSRCIILLICLEGNKLPIQNTLQ